MSLALPPSPSFLFFILFFSHPSAPFCSVFRLSSLREWNTIKDLIKTPEQAKALWQRARLGSARTGSAGRQLPIRPPELGCELGIEQGGREQRGEEGLGSTARPALAAAPVPGTAGLNRC